MNVPDKLEVRSFTLPELIGGIQKSGLSGYAHATGGRRWSRMVPFEKAFVSS